MKFVLNEWDSFLSDKNRFLGKQIVPGKINSFQEYKNRRDTNEMK